MTLSDISVEMVLASLSLACDLSGMPPVPPSVADRLWNFGSNSWVENLEAGARASQRTVVRRLR